MAEEGQGPRGRARKPSWESGREQGAGAARALGGAERSSRGWGPGQRQAGTHRLYPLSENAPCGEADVLLLK